MKYLWQIYIRISDHRWAVVGIMGGSAFILGFIGYSELDRSYSPSDVFYLTLQLFVMYCESPAAGWKLDISRWLAILATMSTAFIAAVALFHEQMKRISLRYVKDHAVICGIGRKGIRLVKELCGNERVVVIEADEKNDNIPVCQQLGAVVLNGDATDSIMLGKAGVSRAKYVIAVCDKDGVNVEIAVKTGKLLQKEAHRRNPVNCFVHVVNLRLCTLFRQHGIFLNTGSNFNVQVFNIFEISARMMLKENPPDREPIGISYSRRVHLVVIGFGQMGESLVTEAAKIAHYANGKHLCITVIDREAGTKETCFRTAYPRFGEICDIRFIASDYPLQLEQAKEWAADPNFLTSFFITLDDDTASLSCALSFDAVLSVFGIPFFVRMANRNGLAVLFENDDGKLSGHIKPFGIIREICTKSFVLDEKPDRLAKKIHRNYLQKSMAAGVKMESKPSMQPWKYLNLFYRSANRQQADHIYVKLRAVGALVCRETEENGSFAFTDQEIEVLAKMEHARWCAQYYLEGYTRGPRDDEKKTHPDLVPWEELSEEAKDYDRETVRNIPEYLRLIGERVCRGQSSGRLDEHSR